MPPIEETSAPSTKPACTPLDNRAWRSGEMAASRAMSGSTAAEANHRLMPAISATTSNDTDRFFDGLAPGMSAFLPLRTRLRAGQATGNGAGAWRRRLCRNWRRCRLQSGCASAALPAWREVIRASIQVAAVDYCSGVEALSFRRHEFHPASRPRPALHGHRDRLLCHQRHDDEAGDRRACPPTRCCSCAASPRRIWGFPLVLAARLRPPAGAASLDRRVLLRNLFELGGILAYVVALANMQIADAIALGQVAPLLILLGASVAVSRAHRRAAHGADRARLRRRADGGAADHAGLFGLCAAGARPTPSSRRRATCRAGASPRMCRA